MGRNVKQPRSRPLTKEQPKKQARESYLLIPEKIADPRAGLLRALNAYCMIANLYIASGGKAIAVPSTAADAGEEERASLHQLRQDVALLASKGWLLMKPAHDDPQVECFIPTWGTVNGKIYPWNIDAKDLGRPASIQVIPVPLALIVGGANPFR